MQEQEIKLDYWKNNLIQNQLSCTIRKPEIYD